MSLVLKIKHFKGLAGGSEDPEEFFDDIQAAAEGWHMTRPADCKPGPRNGDGGPQTMSFVERVRKERVV